MSILSRDITETEEWIVKTTLKERYGRDIDLQYADAEIRLNPADRELTSCPVFVWEADGCHFVIFKTGERRYRCQFFLPRLPAVRYRGSRIRRPDRMRGVAAAGAGRPHRPRAR